jgi:hypothetical protein
VLLVSLAAWACVDGGIAGGRGPVPIDVQPAFQIDPGLFPASLVDRIRVRALDASTAAVLGTLDVTVDPSATEWTLSLGIATDAPVEVILEIELLSGETVEWSGRDGPFLVQPGRSSATLPVDVFRGPLDNLDVTSIDLQEAPAQMLVGETATLTATPTLSPQSTASPVVYWVSEDSMVARVTPTGPTATLEAVAPGTVDILAGAGTASAQATVEVLPRVSAVVVSPTPVTLDALGQTAQLAAAVTDGFGNPDAAAAVTWASTDASVVQVDSTGLVTAVGYGSAQVDATSFGVAGSATVDVSGPDLVPSAFTVVPDQAPEIVSLAETRFQVEVENVGSLPAGASTLQVLVLDASTQSEAHPPLVFAVPALAPSATFSVDELGGEQVQPVTLPSSIVFEAVVDAGLVVDEQDEGNNTASDGPFAVQPPPLVTGRAWVGGDPGGPTDWGVAANWQPVGVPTSTDTVTIDVAGGPVLATAVAVRGIRVGPTSTLDLSGFTLTVDANVDAAGTIAGGVVEVTAAGSVLQGNFDELHILSVRALSGTTTTTGPLVLTNADLDVGSQSIVVGGDLSVTGGSARLIMTTAGGSVAVAGDALFDGGSQSGSLTQGELRVAGDLTASNTSSSLSFVASIDHTTILDGAGPQLVTFSNPGTAAQRFHHLTVENVGGTVILDTDIVATGDVSIFGESVLDAPGRTISAGGSFVVGSGVAIFQELIAIGDLTAISSPLTADLLVSAAVTLPSDLVVQGDVRVNNADLTIGAFSLTVADSLTVRGGSAQLVMANAAGIVDVAGHVLFDGGVSSGWLTAGLLRVAGDFTVATTSTPSAFVGSIAHTTVFDGAGAQTVAFSNPGQITQRFHHLSVENLGGVVTFASDFVATGDVTIQGQTVVSAAGRTISAGGSFTDLSAVVTFQELVAIGDLTAVSSPLAADLRVTATLNLPNNLAVQGDVRVDDADLVVGAFALTLTDSLTVRGGNAQLSMSDGRGIVDVDGHAVFDGGTQAGFLTAGQIRVAGDFTAAQSSSPLSFVGQGTHQTRFDGGGLQTVTLSNPGATGQRFEDVLIENLGGVVTLATDIVATGDVVIFGQSTISAAGRTISAGGSFTDLSTVATFQELIAIGNLTAITSPLRADLRVSATLNLPANLVVQGDVRLANNDLIIGAFGLTVGDPLTNADSLTVRGASAQFIMQNASGSVVVNGHALFDGGGVSGLMTAGELRVRGDFTVGSTSSTQSFIGSVSHTTVFDGNGTQTVTLESPGPTTQRFQNVTMENFGGIVNLATTVPVMGTLFSDDVTLGRTGPVGTALDVRGIANVNFTTFVGLPLRVTSGASPLAHVLSGLFFTSMDAADVQLRLELPGVAGALVQVTNSSFDTPAGGFTTGAHVEAQRLSGTTTLTIEIIQTSPFPGTFIQGPGTQILQL